MGHLAARLKTFSLFFTVVYLLAFLNQEWTQFFIKQMSWCLSTVQ